MTKVPATAVAAFGAACWVVALLPHDAMAQRNIDGAYVEGRLALLQRSVSDLSSRLEQLKLQDRDLQQRMERMQSSLGQRLERLEARQGQKAAPRPGPPPR